MGKGGSMNPFKSNKKLIAAGLVILAATLLWAAVGKTAEVPPGLHGDSISARAFAELGAEIVHVVESGDTLADISKFYFGKYKYWEYLAEANELGVEWREGIPYVWIKPGQVLTIWGEQRLTVEQVAAYFKHTKMWMEEKIFSIASIRDPFPRDDSESFVIGFANRPSSSKLLRRWIRYLDHQDRYRAVDQMYDEILANISSVPFETSERYWEDHRKMAALLMAILDAESDGYMVRGKRGEAGRWQIMPATFAAYKGWPTDAIHRDIAVEILMDDNLEGLRCAMDRLSKKHTVKEALAYYNGYGDEARAYANRVYYKYQKALKEVDVFAKTVTKREL